VILKRTRHNFGGRGRTAIDQLGGNRVLLATRLRSDVGA
jgi:hypothetical protein